MRRGPHDATAFFGGHPPDGPAADVDADREDVTPGLAAT